MKDLKCVFDFQIRICFDTESMTNVYTYTSLNVLANLPNIHLVFNFQNEKLIRHNHVNC